MISKILRFGIVLCLALLGRATDVASKEPDVTTTPAPAVVRQAKDYNAWFSDWCSRLDSKYEVEMLHCGINSSNWEMAVVITPQVSMRTESAYARTATGIARDAWLDFARTFPIHPDITYVVVQNGSVTLPKPFNGLHPALARSPDSQVLRNAWVRKWFTSTSVLRWSVSFEQKTSATRIEVFEKSVTNLKTAEFKAKEVCCGYRAAWPGPVSIRITDLAKKKVTVKYALP